ncbi:MAG: aminodeoxychorismate/anthranilate synthase component II [Cyclobacteriaceae bacterium]
MRILLLDNYDSFTYNLAHLVRELGYGDQLDIIRNDKISIDEVDQYDKIILSPGPGLPKDAGIMTQLILRYASTKSILGVCLGHQAIAEAFGGKLYNMPVVLHGVADEAHLKSEDIIFKGLPKHFKVCRYHSWTVMADSLNGALQVTAIDQNQNVMAIRHSEYDVCGVQFHPESIITEHGREMIANWISGVIPQS